MKQINKKELINILKRKNNKTYKELSIETGYHEKYLIRLNSILKKNNYNLINKKRISNNHIDNSIKNKIIADYKNNKYKSYKEIYIKYKELVSYSYICKLLNNIKLDKEILIIAKTKYNNIYYYIAIDYKTKTIIYKVPTNKNNIKEVLLYVFINNGVPNNIYFYNIKHNNYLLKKYNINILNNMKIINKNIYSLLKDNITKYNNIKYQKYIYSKDDIYNHIKRKVLKNNIIQFNNIRYKIISKKLIRWHQVVDLYYNNDISDIYIKYNNRNFNLKKDKTAISVKGLTKYK